MMVTGLTAERMRQIEAAGIIDGDVDVNGNLILTRYDGSTINAGLVRGPKGDPGDNVDAKLYSDAGDTSTLNSAKSYADTGDTNTLTSAKAYSDTFVKGTVLGSGVDLNTITTPGNYHQSLTANAQSGTNYPPLAVAAGLLEVAANGSNMVWQRYTPYGPYSSRIFQRAFYNGTWDPWHEVAGAGALVKVGIDWRTTNTTATSSEYNINSFTLPNPQNGDVYRIHGIAKCVPDTAGAYTALRIRHGSGAIIGGTQIALEYVDHRIAGRIVTGTIFGEFTYTGTSGATGYNVVMTGMVGGGGTSYVSAQSGAAATLTVDRVLR